ncbi:alpha/beta fold hydrolase [Georgenia sp. AZ-5]|uniref:alpha/beta fold hydrolase n=1 Tax=Georgenia sp. AZ-5 TaxID=3367526 RepID=UPI003754B12D
MSTTRWIDRPGGRVAYDVTGTGPLVIAVPGMGDVRQEYRHLVPHLVRGGLRVATTDLRGHGDSDATFTRFGDVETAGDVLALADELSPGAPVLLAGSSMGAAAALWAAAERPERVSALVLLGPFARDARTPALARWLMRVALLRPWGPRAWVTYHRSLFAGRPPADHADHAARNLAALRRPAHWRAFTETVRQLTHAPVEARLGEVRAPALVVMGGKDPDFPDPAAEAAWLGERLGAEVLVRPVSGHYPHADDAAAVGPAVAAFLTRVAGTRVDA